MFAVIFRANPAAQGALYSQTVETMRALAFEKYGCVEFITAIFFFIFHFLHLFDAVTF